jgi:hypothetical protein
MDNSLQDAIQSYDESIRLIPFHKIRECGEFPRYPDNKDCTIPFKEFSLETYNKSLIVFVSHRWLRGEKGCCDTAHPDDDAGSKYTLCVNGIRQMMECFCPGMEECYLWMDYCCIDQDSEPMKELKFLESMEWNSRFLRKQRLVSIRDVLCSKSAVINRE